MIAALLLSFIPIAGSASAPAPSAPAVVLSQSSAATGVVRDASGAAVPGAVVVARTAAGNEQRTVTGPNGTFTIALPPPFELTVLAGGFAVKRQSVTSAASPIDVTVVPAGLTEMVTVSATRGEQRVGDVPASTTVITREDIRRSPAIVPDDLFRQLPQFALFRRASSLSAHPTSQGVSLRGIGPSGVSRSLVMLDGVPFNDGFGGWVYWTGLPLEGADRVEVVDGATSSLYGTYAMGGVINIMSRPPTPKTLELRTQYGSRQSPKVEFRGSHVMGKIGLAVDGTLFDTDGYTNVVEINPAGDRERGPIDTNVKVAFKNIGGKLDYNPNDRVRLFVRGGYFTEKRINGKRSTFAPTVNEANDTEWKYVSAGVRVQLPGSSDLQASFFSNTKDFRSNFLAISGTNPPRSVGRVALNQVVPSDDAGGGVQWSRVFARMHVVTAGGDFRRVDGDSLENVMNFTHGLTPVTRRVAGGTQRNMGAFIQDIIQPNEQLTVTLSARVDRWRNYDPHHTETSVATGVVTTRPLAPRQDTVASPRAGILYRFTPRVSVWGDIATGFRAPTLNELYRQFSVGAVVTRANDQLGPERLKGGELGFGITPIDNLTIRSTWFDNRVKDPVSNTTIGTNLQQRRNLGRTRIWGLQSEVDYRFNAFWRVTGSYLYEEAKVTENPENPALVGLYLAQVPKNRATFQVQYTNPRYLSAFLDIEAVGRQFDEDQNTRAIPGLPDPGLPGYTLVNVNVSRALSSNVDLFLGAVNLLNKEFYIGTLPTIVGAPRMVTGGVRLRWQGQ